MPSPALLEAPVDRVPHKAPGSLEIGFSVPSRYNASAGIVPAVVARERSRVASAFRLLRAASPTRKTSGWPGGEP
jgi:hypothetical protein